MIVLFTDFGHHGPYVGQMKAVLHQVAGAVPIVDLLHDAPVFDSRLSSYLLATYAAEFPEGSVFACVVDPGVGSARRPLVLRAGGHWYVGPANGLLQAVTQPSLACQTCKDDRTKAWQITWRPERLSDSFHGRDLFAPIAGRLAIGEVPPGGAGLWRRHRPALRPASRLADRSAGDCLRRSLWEPDQRLARLGAQTGCGGRVCRAAIAPCPDLLRSARR
jgi:S-adenosylmethionine hydrolase